MKNKVLKLVAIFFVIGMISFACKKETASLSEEDYISASDNVYAEKVVFDIFNILKTIPTQTKSVPLCPDINFENNELRIIYPADGCAGTDGVKRSGTIIINFDHDFDFIWSTGEKATITFDNYSIIDNKITGTISIICTSDQPFVFGITSDNMLITSSNSNTISWKTDMVYEMISGSSTVSFGDDVWRIDGTSSGVGSDGKNFTRKAIFLSKEPDCSIFAEGIIILTVESNIYNIEFPKNQCGNVVITFEGLKFPMRME
jgi:hypothetical protein